MKKRKGFTLIELLVVIAIIVLLLAILMPSLSKARNQAKNVVCQSNLKQWGTILMLYTDDNKGWLPSDKNKGIWLLRGPKLNPDGDANLPTQYHGELNTDAKIYHSFTTKGVTLCPMAKKHARSNTTIGFIFNGDMIKVKPGLKNSAWKIVYPVPEFTGSYGFNEGLFDSKFGINVYQSKNNYKNPILLDSAMPYGSVKEPPLYEEDLLRTGTTSFCINRHNGTVNCLFLDWSVRKIGLKELWTLKWDKYFNTANEMTLAGGVEPDDWPEWMKGLKDY